MNRVQDAKGSNLGKPKALLSQGQFLNVAWKAAHWFRGGRLASIDYDKAMLYFKVASHSRKGLFHTVKISLESIADQLYYNKVAERVYNPDPKKKNFTSLADKQMLSHVKPITKQNLTKKLEQGHMKVYCSCEQFLFFGFKYIAWHKGYGLEKESRAPRVRNPKREGAVCIHIFYILAYVFPQILPQVERLLIKEGLLDYLKEPVKNNDKDDKLKK